MKLKILSIGGTEVGKKDLPEQFLEPVRADLIQRAVLAIHSHERQPYGAFPEAGKQASAFLSKRRRNFKGTYGRGQSRTPRKVLSRNGTQFNFVGANAPGTVKGRQAHPPKAGRIWDQKINRQERQKAIRSAMAATMIIGLVEKRGHHLPKDYPFLIESKIETIQSTKEAVQALHKLGLTAELERCGERRVRAGKGKLRGRKYKTRKGPLLVIQGKTSLLQAARNIPGVDIVDIQNLNASLLAPGTHYGRLTLFTEGAIEYLAQNKLFTRYSVKQVQVHKKNEVPQKTNVQSGPAVAGEKKTPKKDTKKVKAPAKKEVSKK
ncbi:MAG: 50S ribosomal protein L4 [Nanoarchaeota archaeon]